MTTVTPETAGGSPAAGGSGSPRPGPGTAALTSPLRAVAARLLERWRARRGERRTYLALTRLGARRLDDLGLTPDAVRRRLWRDGPPPGADDTAGDDDGRPPLAWPRAPAAGDGRVRGRVA